MRVPTKEEEQERIEYAEYRDRECLKIIKKYAQKELDEINQRRLLTRYNEGRINFLKFVLKSKSFVGLPIESFQKNQLKKSKIYHL
jgi:hypothetical protein